MSFGFLVVNIRRRHSFASASSLCYKTAS